MEVVLELETSVYSFQSLHRRPCLRALGMGMVAVGSAKLKKGMGGSVDILLA
jgi:hypothetical protein